MRRKGFTLVEIMIVILIIGMLLAIAVPQFITARLNSQRTTCYANQQKIEEAKQHWIMDTGQNSSSTPTIRDLVPVYLKSRPICPTNAIYSFGNGTSQVSCPDHPLP